LQPFFSFSPLLLFSTEFLETKRERIACSRHDELYWKITVNPRIAIPSNMIFETQIKQIHNLQNLL